MVMVVDVREGRVQPVSHTSGLARVDLTQLESPCPSLVFSPVFGKV